MLQLISTGTGGGMSAYIKELIKRLAERENENITLTVPEQYSFTCEKEILTAVGEKKAARIDVLSFTRLAEKLIGKPAFYEKRRLSPASAAVLMKMALNEVKSSLTVYGKHTERRSTVNEFSSLSSEFKQNAISTENIRALTDKLPASLLKAKLSDMAMVFEAYDKRVESSYFNPDNLLTELEHTAQLDAYLNGRTVIIDSFRGFTAQEYEIIAHMIKNAENVFVTLCAGNYSEDEPFDITELFAKTKNTASRLNAIAEKSGVTVGKPLIFTEKSDKKYFDIDRYTCDELRFLEKELYSNENNRFEGKCENIALCKASDIYSECEFVAVTIKKLIRENGYRFRDIAVIARQIDKYKAPLRSALKKCGITIFEDYRKPADVSPIINIISAALSAVSKSFDNDSLMRYLKTGLTGLTTDEISQVENYCCIWRITGSSWKSEWTGNPEGIGEADEKTESRLEYLNSLRLKITEPLIKLKELLSGGVSGEAALNALWSFTQEINLRDNIAALAHRLTDDGETGAVLELDRMWNLLISVFDELSALLKEETDVTAAKLSEYFELMLSVQTVGNIPQGLDEVVIGSADRIRLNAPRAVFILGANEGVFPPDPTIVSALTLQDRKEMKSLGLELSNSGEMKIAEEKLIAYNSVCCAHEKLFVTCSAADESGAELEECEFYSRIKDIFPDIVEYDASSLDDMFYVEGKQLAFEQLAKSKDKTFEATVTEYFKADDFFAGKLEALKRAENPRAFEISDKENAEKLFGKVMHLSASRIEKYYKCPFSYFCQYGLKAMPIRVAKLDPIEKGTLVHRVLEQMLLNYGVDEINTMSDEQLMKAIFKITDDFKTAELSDSIVDERFNYNFDTLNKSLFNAVKRIAGEFKDSKFRPVSFELGIGDSSEIPEYVPENSRSDVKINGKIDRVDTASASDGNLYLRIIDYKSSGKNFSLSEAVNGINLQMPIYLFTLMKNGRKKFGDFKPAGLLYYKSGNTIVSADINEDVSDILAEKSKSVDGILLDNSEVVGMMGAENTGINKLLTISEEEFKYFNKKTDKLINEMVRSLKNGEIPPYPYKAATDVEPKTCTYCDYKSVCGYENDIDAKCFPTGKAVDKNIISENFGEEGTENETKME